MANTRAKEDTLKNSRAQSNGSDAVRTTRVTRRKVAVNYAELDSSDSDSSGGARPRKRARKNNAQPDASDGERRPARAAKKSVLHRKGLRGKAGGLAAMPDMPLDIVNNILEYLGPQELLNLTRTSKEFRALLLDSSYARLWKNSFLYVEGLPECPEHMSPPAYANLVFSPHCHNCFKNNVHSILWEFGVRYCNNCRDNLITSHLPYDISKVRDFAWQFLNSIHIGRRIFYHWPQVDEFTAAWESLPEDNPENDDVSEQPENSEVQDKLIIEWTARTQPIQDHAHLCHRWMGEQARLRAEAREDIRELRLQAIIDKLREEGYGRELEIMSMDDYSELADHKHARQPNRLTERAWQNMKDDLLAIMEETRTECVAEQHTASLQARLAYLKEHLKVLEILPRTVESQCGPRFLDFAYMAEFRELVEGPGTDEDACKALEALFSRLPEFVQRWREETRSQLVNMAKKCIKIDDVPGGVDPLQLATIWFKCTGCSKIMEYPTVVAHRCDRPSGYRDPQDKAVKAQEYRDMVWHYGRDSHWSVDKLTCCTLLTMRAQILVQACGKDPFQTTKQEMDDLNERFRCKTFDRSGTQLIMSWRAALFKLDSPESVKFDMDRDTWQVIAATERAEADKLEYNGLPALLEDFQCGHNVRKWSCTRCSGYNATRCSFNDVKVHIQKEHGIQNPSVPGDIFLDASAAHRVPIPLSVCLLSRSLPLHSLTDYDMALLKEGRAAFYDFSGQNVDVRAWRVPYDAKLECLNRG